MVHSVSGWMRGVQVKLWDPLRTHAIPERLRGVFTTRRYTNPRLPLPLPYQLRGCVSRLMLCVCFEVNFLTGTSVWQCSVTSLPLKFWLYDGVEICITIPRPTQPSIPPGSVNEYQLWLGRQR